MKQWDDGGNMATHHTQMPHVIHQLRDAALGGRVEIDLGKFLLMEEILEILTTPKVRGRRKRAKKVLKLLKAHGYDPCDECSQLFCECGFDHELDG